MEVQEKKEIAQKEYAVKKHLSKEEKKIKNRIDFLEKEIEKLEAKQKELEAVLGNPGQGDDIMELTRTYLENKRELDSKTDEWAELSEKLDL